MYGADPMDTDARGRNAAQVAESANFLGHLNALLISFIIHF